MTKKRKLNSKNPKYQNKEKKQENIIKKKILACEGPNETTNVKFKAYAVFFEDDI